MNAVVLRMKAVFDEQAKQVELLRQQAHCDPLTGLSHRRHFMAQLGAALSSEEGSGDGVIYLIRLSDLAGINRLLGHRQTDAFTDGAPWLLRFFDQIRFFPVSHDELTEWRRDFPLGRRAIRIEETEFRLADYRAFLADNAESITAFEARRNAAFAAERADWAAKGEFDRVASLTEAPVDEAEAGVAPPVEAWVGLGAWALPLADPDAG